MSANDMTPPPIALERSNFDSPNIFRDRFGQLDDAAWLQVLIRSIDEPVIDGVAFPRFPSPDLQNNIHGHSGAHSLTEAFEFYRFVKRFAHLPYDGRFLDFASGWGRITRPFLRDFPLVDMYGYDPENYFRATARALNPYVCFLGGGPLPAHVIPGPFDLIVGWSIFSHLSLEPATLWLHAFANLLTPGGLCVLTTWGLRFLERLADEQRQLAAGGTIHWYSKVCLDGIGDVQQQIDRYRAGEFVWFTSGTSTLYGEAFLGLDLLERLIAELDLPLEILAYDAESLPQDAFVLRRME